MAAEPNQRSSIVEGQPEQSMDEILASIRQIIADDKPQGTPGNERRGLTPPADISNNNATAPKMREPVLSVQNDTSTPNAATGLEAIIAAGMAKAMSADSTPPDADQTPRIVKPLATTDLDTTEVARDVVSRWIGTHNDELTRQVEAVVAPVVRTWLAEHLPAMVERLIREEIEAVSRGTGG